MALEVWTAQIECGRLADYVEQWWQVVAEAQPQSWLMIAWWNRSGTFAPFAEGLAELAATPDDSERGSAFGHVSELRWRRVQQQIWLVALAEIPLAGLAGSAGWQPVAVDALGWDGERREEQQLLLWGTEYQGDEQWAELRIPRLLRYPVEPARSTHIDWEHATLHVIIYQDEAGKTVLWRRTAISALLPQSEEENEPVS